MKMGYLFGSPQTDHINPCSLSPHDRQGTSKPFLSWFNTASATGYNQTAQLVPCFLSTPDGWTIRVTNLVQLVLVGYKRLSSVSILPSTFQPVTVLCRWESYPSEAPGHCQAGLGLHSGAARPEPKPSATFCFQGSQTSGRLENNWDTNDAEHGEHECFLPNKYTEILWKHSEMLSSWQINALLSFCC